MSHSRKSVGGPQRDPILQAYAARMIQERLEKLLGHQEGVRDGETDEPVHQMRVWSRRTRAALDIFHPCFPGKEFAALEREVKAVTGALGAARDLDVMIATLQKRADKMTPEERAGVDSFIEQLQRQRHASQKSLIKTMEHLDRQDLKQRFEEMAEKHGIVPFEKQNNEVQK